MKKKLCFVIMGYGKKTDPSTGRTLDLDQTYKNIIKPAVLQSGFDCIRGDEVKESGLIDKSMYALLMQSDLVVADISTHNPNAIYELGIRHAVRPYSTVIIQERETKIPFDLNHNKIFHYVHSGDDIGVDEANRCINSLSQLIKHVADNPQTDSPLYEYINNITPPELPEDEYRDIIKELADKENKVFGMVEQAKVAMKDSRFYDATVFWKKASDLVPTESYFVQQHALSRYKSKHPSENTALIDALAIIRTLDPTGETTDPETLGITGAIYKRLWLLENDIEYLKRAISLYGKCYQIRNDYYTGENYALCLNLSANVETDDDEKIYAKMAAKKTRQNIVENLENDVINGDINNRNDRKWVYASLSHCYFALDNLEKSTEFERLFLLNNPLDWEKETFYSSKKILIDSINYGKNL